MSYISKVEANTAVRACADSGRFCFRSRTRSRQQKSQWASGLTIFTDHSRSREPLFRTRAPSIKSWTGSNSRLLSRTEDWRCVVLWWCFAISTGEPRPSWHPSNSFQAFSFIETAVRFRYRRGFVCRVSKKNNVKTKTWLKYSSKGWADCL